MRLPEKLLRKMSRMQKKQLNLLRNPERKRKNLLLLLRSKWVTI